MQHALAFVPVLILVPVLVFLLPVLIRLLRSPRPRELRAEWFEDFHISSYIPMQGLLAQDDFRFLSGQPGFDPSLHKKLRSDRLRIFRQYLNRLIVDFNRLYTLADQVLAQSKEDHSDLFQKLLSLRLHFWLAIIQVEFSYLLCQLGAQSISLGGLLQQVEAISQLAMLPPEQGVLARS